MGDRADTVRQIEESGVVAIVRAKSSAELLDVVGALHDGGLTCIEVTMTTPDALRVIEQAVERFGQRCRIGAGTVLDAETARAAILAGASFVVSPILDEPTIELCRRYSVAVLPGTFTPTEIVRAWQAGADLVKVFPTTTVGPGYLKDLRGPLPQVKLVPTGGVTLETAADFIRAGAAAVGMGSTLVSSAILESRDFDTLRRRAAELLKAVSAARTS